jgi:pimeloyl-ACP methyl ester carboxylesterase
MGQQVVIKENLVSYLSLNSQGVKTAIVFLHGWRSSKEVWQGIVNKLQNLAYPIYVIDLPGFGASPAPKNDFTISDYVSIVAEFINKKHLEQVVLVGHSFGGRIGIRLAAQHQEAIKKLVLVDSAGFVMESRKKSFYNTLALLARPFFKLPFAGGLRKLAYKAIGAEDYLATPALQKTFVNVVSEDLTEDMKKIVCPTLIITGENDKDTPIAFGQKMNSLIHNSKLVVLKKAGHFSFIDNPAEFTNQLTGFIKA